MHYCNLNINSNQLSINFHCKWSFLCFLIHIFLILQLEKRGVEAIQQTYNVHSLIKLQMKYTEWIKWKYKMHYSCSLTKILSLTLIVGLITILHYFCMHSNEKILYINYSLLSNMNSQHKHTHTRTPCGEVYRLSHRSSARVQILSTSLQHRWMVHLPINFVYGSFSTPHKKYF